MTVDPGLTVAMAKRIELWPLDRLKPYDRNARTHSAEQVAQIGASIVEFGFTNPILVDSNDGIIAGHGRLSAAQELGLKTVPVVVLDHLSERQRKAYILADNQLALNAGWDTDLLRGELQDLAELDFDLTLIGFSDYELADLLPDVEELPPEGADEDAAPEVPEEPVTKLGDVWLLGKHRVMCGDSTSLDEVERLMNGGTADMVFTDPPYGVSFVGVKGSMYSAGKRLGRNTAEEIKNDDLRGEDLSALFYDSLSVAVTVCKDQAPYYIFFAINRSSETLQGLETCGIQIRNWLIWDKGNVGFHAMGAQYKPNFEAFLYCHKKGSSPEWSGNQMQQTIWRHSTERLGLHPTMKPVALIEQALANHKAALILDLFGGSGSTLIACEKTSRQARLMELDPRYCDVIVKRWQQFTSKRATLEATGEPFPADA